MSIADPEFEIEVTITSPTLGKTRTLTNVHNFTVIKAPFQKLANLTSVTVEADYAFLSAVASDVKTKKEPSCNISIYHLEKDSKKGSPSRGKRATMLYGNDFFIYFAIDEQGLSDTNGLRQLQDESRTFTFILANRIIHWLQTNHDHIVLLDGSTASGAIGAYEGYLQSKFEGDAFSFQNVAVDANPSVYDQIFCRSKWDLGIPSDLILNYKAYNSLAYYYYDDFSMGVLIGNNLLTPKNIAVPNKKYINNITLSLGSVETLPKVDLLDINHKDSMLHVSVDGVEPASDLFLKFQKSAATMSVATSDEHVTIGIPTVVGDGRPVVKTKTVTSYAKGVTTKGVGRTVYGRAGFSGGVPIIPKHYAVIYSPDGAASGSGRYAGAMQMINQNIKSYIEMTFQQCYPDLINLTSMYNLDAGSRTAFAFLPIMITNIFHKQQSKDAKLTHSIKAKFIEFNL